MEAYAGETMIDIRLYKMYTAQIESNSVSRLFPFSIGVTHLLIFSREESRHLKKQTLTRSRKKKKNNILTTCCKSSVLIEDVSMDFEQIQWIYYGAILFGFKFCFA